MRFVHAFPSNGRSGDKLGHLAALLCPDPRHCSTANGRPGHDPRDGCRFANVWPYAALNCRGSHDDLGLAGCRANGQSLPPAASQKCTIGTNNHRVLPVNMAAWGDTRHKERSQHARSGIARDQSRSRRKNGGETPTALPGYTLIGLRRRVGPINRLGKSYMFCKSLLTATTVPELDRVPGDGGR